MSQLGFKPVVKISNRSLQIKPGTLKPDVSSRKHVVLVEDRSCRVNKFFFLYVFNIIFSSFHIVSKFISNWQKYDRISNFAFDSCVWLWIYYIIIFFPFAGCICLRNCFISFRPRTIWDKYDQRLGSSSVAMSRVPVSMINSRLCKMHD